MRTKLELTARGRLCLMLVHLTGGAAWLTGDDSARLALALITAPFLIDLIWKKLRAPRLEVEFPPRRTRVGSAFLEAMQLRNTATDRAIHQLTIREPRTVTATGGGFVTGLDAGAAVTVRLASRSRRRGLISRRTIQASSDYPFGMLRWNAEFSVPAEMITEPARAELPAELFAELERPAEADVATARNPGFDYFCLRDYRPGEDARHVHAQRSAATGQLVTRVYRSSPDPELVLLLDCRRSPGVAAATIASRFERSLSVAAAIVDEISNLDVRLQCTAIDTELRHFPIGGQAEGTAFLTYLAAVRSVAYRPLTADENATLPVGDLRYWLAAAGYRDPRVPVSATADLLEELSA